MAIPPRIIQTAKSRELLPEDQAAVDAIIRLHPEWEYCFFDDVDVTKFMEQESVEYRRTFDQFHYPIQRYDFFRYLAVLRLGGFYLDVDIVLSAPLGPLLDLECVFPFEEITLNRFLRRRYGMDWELGNYAFGASPGHPFLQLIVENCVRGQQDPRWLDPMLKGVHRMLRSEYYVLNSTGPGLVSRTFAEYPNVARKVKILFPADVCDERSWHRFGEFGVHSMKASWRNRQNHLWRRFVNRWEALCLSRLMQASADLGPRRDAFLRQAGTCAAGALTNK
jgi:hypothetical protein